MEKLELLGCFYISLLFVVVFVAVWSFRVFRLFSKMPWRPLWQWLSALAVALLAGFGFVTLSYRALDQGSSANLWYIVVFFVEYLVLWAMAVFERRLDKRYTIFRLRTWHAMEKMSILLEVEEEKQPAEVEQVDEEIEEGK